MVIERNYEFRQRLNVVHKPNRRDMAVSSAANDVEISSGWKIAAAKTAAPLVINVAKDLQDYFFTSMGISVPVELMDVAAQAEKTILLAEKSDLPELGNELKAARSYRLQVAENHITVCGNDDRGVAQGSYFLEDLMNLRRAPLLEKQNIVREPKFSPRMSHSGWGIDQFPDAHLNAIAHAGMDSILIFAKGVNHSTMGLLDFNDLIDRAGSFGLDVYFYSYLHSELHPDDPGAEAFYDGTYGKLFRECPKARGVILVGESCEFPSKDERTTGKIGASSCYEDGIRELKPRPGWWPCTDFPEWLEMIKKVVRKNSADAEIVFWTYNWGWAPLEERERLLNSIPEGITLQVTFEMFDQVRRDGIVNPVMDYTITYPGPGKYFLSEAEIAKKRGIKLYTMCNTGGCTWDFGATPYEPVPYQWLKRYRKLFEAREKFGLCGLMENHHYGYYPSFVSEFAKWMYWEPDTDPDEILKKLAERDFGSGADDALACWQDWSEAINDLIPTNEDQYGPLRSGPSYPLIFHPDITRTFDLKEIEMPTDPNAHFGARIIKTFYHPYENEGQSPGAMRYPVEVKTLERMRQRWECGLGQLKSAVVSAPESCRDEAEQLLALGEFISNSVTTVINVKKWWMLNMQLLVETSRAAQNRILDELVELAKAEIANAEATIPAVERNSRLGWEPSMEYVCDRWHLEWKIRQVKKVINEEIPAYRNAVNVE